MSVVTMGTATREVKGWLVLALEGDDVELSMFDGVPLFRQAAVEQLASGCDRLVLDLTNVTFVDSTGLGVLIGICKRMRALGGTLLLVATSAQVLMTLNVTGLDQIFEIHKTVEAALSDRPEV